ncbi:hypothetical protein [Gordonia sp. MP11Mi]|uniref:Uncharacterized protein n=1 Tax=Gordonia sp. MP11Mi TaxID=3022769 RepID=A0AA97CXU3_9ACTN
MTADDPLHVSFHVHDEKLAHYLDKLIRDHGGDPDQWFNDLIAEHQQTALAAIPARLAALAEKVSAHIDPEKVAAWDGRAPANPPPRLDSARRRPRRPKPSSEWRTR